MFGKELMILNITKEEILKRDMSQINKLLKTLENDVKANFQILHPLFDGYNDSPLEIYEIDAIRKYCDKMVNNSPQIFYFLEEKLEGFQNIILCISDVEAFHQVNRKSLEEIYEEDPLTYLERMEELPRNQVRVKIPKDKYEKIVGGLIKFGIKNNVVDKIEQVIKRLSMFV